MFYAMNGIEIAQLMALFDPVWASRGACFSSAQLVSNQ